MNIKNLKEEIESININLAIVKNDLSRCVSKLEKEYSLKIDQIDSRLLKLNREESRISSKIERLHVKAQKNYEKVKDDKFD